MWPGRVRIKTQNLWRSLLLLIYVLGDGPMGKTQPWTSRWQALLLAPTLPPLVLVEHEKSQKNEDFPLPSWALVAQSERPARPSRPLAGFGLVLMMRIVLATVCCIFGSWGFVIKLNYRADFEDKVWSRFWNWSSGKIWSWSLVCILLLMFCRGKEVESWSRFWS